MASSRYLYAQKDRTYYLRLIGNLSYITCAGFKSFTDKIINENLAEEIFVDLSEAQSIDSTNLGILAKCALYFKSKKQTDPIIYCQDQDINITLRKNGFDTIFNIVVGDSPQVENMDELSLDKFNNREGLNNALVDAHEVLSKINESNKLKYKDVLKLLRFKKQDDNQNSIS